MVQGSLNTTGLPQLGFGLGLRPPHYEAIFETGPEVDWFEIISENFMDTDGRPRRNLERILERYRVVMHGVSLSIGTVDPLRSDYLKQLKALMAWVKPAWVSDHLCWTGVAHKTTHDLLPMPYTEAALDHVVERILRVQDVLGCPIALENPSTYLEFSQSSVPEEEFLVEMVRRSGCYLLLDVNNVYVSCYNHKRDLRTYIEKLPLDRVIQIHLSGHANQGSHIIDTHDDHVVPEVWELYKHVVQKAGRIPNTMIEWDGNIPEFSVLYDELQRARRVARDQTPPGLADLAQDHAPVILTDQSPLAHLQDQIQRAIMGGETALKQDGFEALRLIRPKPQLSLEAQLGIYQDAYRFRLFDAVAEDFPGLEAYLGPRLFADLVWGLIETQRPDHFDLGRYSLKLLAHLTRIWPDDRIVQGVCRLETALLDVADLAETPRLRFEHIAHLSPEDLFEQRLPLRSALRLLSFEHQIHDFYRQVQEETLTLSDADLGNGVGTHPGVAAGASQLCVFRDDDILYRLELEPLEYQILVDLQAGKTVGAALDRLIGEDLAKPEALSLALTGWFSRWMRHGLLMGPAASSVPLPPLTEAYAHVG